MFGNIKYQLELFEMDVIIILMGLIIIKEMMWKFKTFATFTLLRR